MSKQSKKSSKIGLSNAHIAIYHPESFKFSKPFAVKTLKEMKVSVNMAEKNEYNDNELFEVLDSFDNFEVELTFTDLTPSEQALLLGWAKIGAVKLSGANDDPPWIALMGERFKKNGSKRYFKYFKGKAKLSNEDAKSKGDSVEVQPDTLKIVFGALPDDYPVKDYRSVAKATVDESDPDYANEGEKWYTEVITGQTLEEPEESTAGTPANHDGDGDDK